MKKYYLEPITHNLVVVDTNNGNTEVVPELKNVRVFKSDGEAYMTQGHESNELQSSVREKGTTKRGGKRKCSNCGEPGHIARKCPN
jgi:Zinc knuckle